MTKRLKILLFILVVLAVVLVGLKTWAQEEPIAEPEPEIIEVELDEAVEAADLEISEPKLLPNSPFYFLKNWQRGIQTAFTFNSIKKAELKLRHSSEKLLEARKLAEKTDDPGILKEAAENYEKDINKTKEMTDKIEEKASENPNVAGFLDKFTKQQILHYKILEKLEEKVPETALQKIKETRELHLQRFGEVMEKLENKEEIPERLEKNLKEIKGSEFKDFKNLQILKGIEEKAPEAIKEKIQEVRKNKLEELKEKLAEMPLQNQEKFENYVGKIQGEPEKKIEILEDIKLQLEEKPEIKQGLEKAKERMLEKIKEKSGEAGQACITLWDPVCGEDNKTYSNECFAEVAGVEIAYKGMCK